MSIRLERPGDAGAIRAVQAAAFGRPDEADLVGALRESGDAVLSVVAEEDGQIVGHVLFSRVTIHAVSGESIAALALAPMAVMPDWQRQGVGSALLTEALRECRARRERIVIVLGHPEFYRRFGFSHERAFRLESEYQCDAFMALELEAGALEGLEGRVEHAAPFRRFA